MESTDLKVVFDRMGQIPEDRVKADMDKISRIFDVNRLPEGHLENHSRLYFALQEVIKNRVMTLPPLNAGLKCVN